MSRIVLLILSVAVVLVIGCKRDSGSSNEHDAVSKMPTAVDSRRFYTAEGNPMAGSAKWGCPCEEQMRQHEGIALYERGLWLGMSVMTC